jgi:hypothetical protein
MFAFSPAPLTAESASRISISRSSPSLAVFPPIVVGGVEGEKSPVTFASSPVEPAGSPKRSVMVMSISMLSRSSSMGLSAELPSAGSIVSPTVSPAGLIPVVSGTVRSISMGLFVGSISEGEAAKAAISSGGSSLAVDRRADRGASVTGEARLLVNKEASSADIRNDAEERSSLSGIGGRCKEDRDMAEGRRPGGNGTEVEVGIEVSPAVG